MKRGRAHRTPLPRCPLMYIFTRALPKGHCRTLIYLYASLIRNQKEDRNRLGPHRKGYHRQRLPNPRSPMESQLQEVNPGSLGRTYPPLKSRVL